jgi:hypothetical protein
MVALMSSRGLLISVIAATVFGAGCDKGGGGDLKGLEARVAKLEAEEAKYREMLAMIKTNIDDGKKKQAAQQAQEEANAHADDAVFAVDVTGNQIEGPASGAYVTIIEAWDFA